jgi:hypothetical protein
MKRKIILDLCGGTGSWSKPYKDAGYDVRLITLPEFDVRSYEPPKNVYGILAAPPCTEFSIAKNGSHRKRDFEGGINIVIACLNIIWKCRCQNRLGFWALENPVGYLRQFLGKPNYTFYQWWFGDLGIKRTDLWGYFNEPKQKAFERPNHPYFVKQYKSGKKNQFAWSAPSKPDWYEGHLDRAELRAITPPGFARAFFEANP